MKRSLDSISGGVSGPQSKRASGDERDTKEGDGDNHESSTISTYILQTKSRTLALELMRNKRELAEARKELDMMRKKSREMEALVSLIQRSWSQIDIDSSLLLDSLGDSEVKLPEQGDSELLYKLLRAGSRWNSLDPTNVDKVVPMDIDHWSSSTDIDKAKVAAAQAEESLHGSSSGKASKETQDTTIHSSQQSAMWQIVTEQVQHHLESHTSFTMSLLERLCSTLNEIADLGSREEILRPLTKAKENHSIILTLNDNILKLRSEIIEMKARVQIAENEKIKLEKRLDKALFTVKDLEERGSLLRISHDQFVQNNESITTSTSTAAGGAGDAALVPTASSGNNAAYEKELQEQIELLEKQLAESESAKAKVEMQMTERMAKPFAQTETQVSDLRKTLEELKNQFKLRLAEYVKQIEVLTKERDDYHFVVTQLEQVVSAKIDAVVQETQQEIQRVRNEKAVLETRLCALQASADVSDQLKAQVTELLALEDARNNRIRHLEHEVGVLQETQRQLQRSLDKARRREKALEQQLTSMNAGTSKAGGSNGTNVVSSSGASNAVSSSSGSAATHSDNTANISSSTEAGGDNIQLLLQQAQERCADLEAELVETKASINDFISEIDAVSTEESTARSQSERLLKQIHDYQTVQRDALQDNLRLHAALEESKSALQEMEQKMELMKSLMTSQDQTVTEIRAGEQNMRSDYHTTKGDKQKVTHERDRLLLQVQEAQQQAQEAETKLQAALRRNGDLQSRCDELSKQCESERKRRFDEMRNVSKKERLSRDKKSKGSASNDASANDGDGESSGKGGKKKDSVDQDMLDMTLEMLRCSVCRDRFKNVAITRCFHLFCKECIDENLRNRHRKCPACGEKFGQDDVANVYFTH